MSNVRTCTHIKVSGVRCGSPALRERQFCYFHQRMHRGVRTPPRARLHPIALIEDGESIQIALMEVINGLMRNTLDFKRATLILRALSIAVKNANHAHFDIYADEMVKEVPEYDQAESSYTEDGIKDLEIPFEAAYGADPRASKVYRTHQSAQQAAKEREETIAHYYGYPTVEAYAAAKAATKHVGTAAIACPGGPESVRSAAVSSSATAARSQDLNAERSIAPTQTRSNCTDGSTTRKPPMNVKEVKTTNGHQLRRSERLQPAP